MGKIMEAIFCVAYLIVTLILGNYLDYHDYFLSDHVLHIRDANK